MADILPEQRWLLGMSALLTERNGKDHTVLGGARRPVGARTWVHVLATSWNIHTPSDALAALLWLFDEGHRGAYAESTGASPESLLGWDLGRLASVAGFCYGAYLIDRNTAWSWLQRAAPLVRTAFRSFREMHDSYLRGLETWAGGREGPYENAVRAVEAMEARPDSPIHLPFSLDASNAPPIDDEPTVVAVAPGASIADAIARAGKGGRVLLSPGVYRESLHPQDAVEIVAEQKGETRIEPPGGEHALLVRGQRSVFVRGLHLVSAPGEGGKTVNAVSVAEAFVHLEQCDVRGSHHGIRVLEDGDLHLFDSTVHDCVHSGVFVEQGMPVLLGTRIERVGDHALWRGKGDKAAVLEDVEIAEAGQSGASIAGSGILRRTRIRAPGTSALIVQGAVEVTDSSLEGGSLAVVAVSEGGALSMTGGSVGGGARINVQIGGGKASFARTIVQGTAGCGVVVQGKGSVVRLSEVEILDHDQANVYLVDGGVALCDGCTLRGGSVGLWSRGGSGLFAGCTIEQARDAGVQLAGTLGIACVDCTVRASSGSGVAIEAGGAGRFSRCSIEGSTGPGIELGAGARGVFEDCKSTGHGAPDATAEGTAIMVQAGVMDARSLVLESGGQLSVFLTENPAFAYFLDARGVPSSRELLANTLVTACEEAVRDREALSYEVEGDRLVVSGRTPREVTVARDALASTLSDGARLRALVDRVESQGILAEG